MPPPKDPIKYEEFIKKLSGSQKRRFKNIENHPMFGKHHSKEARERMSELRKGKYCGENHPMFGKHLTEEKIKKISDKAKERWEDP
jgi:hypothetical protein